MNVIETFFYLFDSDASKLDKGISEADKKVKGLKDDLDKTDASASKVGGELLKIAKNAAGVLAGFIAFSTVSATILETANAIDDMGDAADALGLPVEELSAWSQAVVMSDGTQQGFTDSLRQFNIGLNDVAIKGKGRLLPFLKEMGLNMADIKRGAKDPLETLSQLSEKFQELTRPEAAALGAKLGLDQGTINLLSQGRRGIEEIIARQRELGVVTEAETEAAAKFDEQMKETNATYATVKRELTTAALPAITSFLNLLQRFIVFMKENKPFIIGFFASIAAVITAAYLPAIIAANAATIIAMGTFLGIAAVIAGFGVVLGLTVDDIYNFMKGNDSVIGELSKKWPRIGESFKAVGGALTILIEIFRAFGKLVWDILTLNGQAVDNFVKAINFLVEDAESVIPGIGTAFTKTGDFIVQTIMQILGVWNDLISTIKTGIGWLNSANTAVGNSQTKIIKGQQWVGDVQTGIAEWLYGPKASAAVTAGRGQLNLANTPMASQSAASINAAGSSRSTSVQIDKVEVQTAATDAPGIASAMSSELGTQMRGAIDQFDDGVAA